MAANLQTITNVSHGMRGQGLTTSDTSILSGGTDYYTTYKINSIIVSNIDGTNDVDVTVRWQGYYGGSAHIAKTVTVPADSTLVVTTQDNPLYISAYGAIYGYASANSDAEILISYEIITASNATFGNI